jgi:hypothetical protein
MSKPICGEHKYAGYQAYPRSMIGLMMEVVSTFETSVNLYDTHGATSQKTAILTA